MLSSLLFAVAARAQTPAPPPEVKQFAFWVGSWECEGTSYNPQNPSQTTSTKGKNKITMDMGGFVVHEHFEMQGFKGESWSVYNANQKKWHQAWVDNGGAYIALEGEFQDGKMILTTLPNPRRPKNFSRMVFSNITKNAFDWDWEGSSDEGKTWQLNWHLHYKRKRQL